MEGRPILIEKDMVRLIWDGCKRQKRLAVEPQPPEGAWPIRDILDCYYGEGWAFQYPKIVSPGITYNAIFQLPHRGQCPYGKYGDRLWVQEAWRNSNPVAGWCNIEYEAGGSKMIRPTLDQYDAALKFKMHRSVLDKWTPANLMPQWASRFTLEITNIRIESLAKITAEDIQKEGLFASLMLDPRDMASHVRDKWSDYWDVNYGNKYPWASNPWVWVISFKKIATNGQMTGW
jgi:hypothetical protein